MKSKRLLCVREIARMEETRNTYRIFVGRPLEKGQLEDQEGMGE
jgi:hypothetical protein